MSAITPVRVRAVGDAWVVEHPEIAESQEYREFESASEVASKVAAEEGCSVEFEHPRNPDLRGMEA